MMLLRRTRKEAICNERSRSSPAGSRSLNRAGSGGAKECGRGGQNPRTAATKLRHGNTPVKRWTCFWVRCEFQHQRPNALFDGFGACWTEPHAWAG